MFTPKDNATSDSSNRLSRELCISSATRKCRRPLIGRASMRICAHRTAQVRSRMRGRGAGWAYPNAQVKGGGGGRQGVGAGRAEASMRTTLRSTSAALCYGFTEAECPLTPQAARRRPGFTGRRRPRWPSAGPARGIALRIGVHAAYARY